LSTKNGAELVAAMDDLGAMLYAPATKPILGYLKDSDQAVREAAAKALAILGNEEVAPDLVPYLTDADPIIRRAVARSLEVAMPESLAKDAAKQAADSSQDTVTRIRLIGALQFHAPARLARETTVDILKSSAPAEVRQRAAYALGRVAAKDDTKLLTKLFADEADPYVTLRLAFTLNKLTGVQQSTDDRGPIALSKPGQREDFIAKWLANK
jgi:HEAT repeat protein